MRRQLRVGFTFALNSNHKISSSYLHIYSSKAISRSICIDISSSLYVDRALILFFRGETTRLHAANTMQARQECRIVTIKGGASAPNVKPETRRYHALTTFSLTDTLAKRSKIQVSYIKFYCSFLCSLFYHGKYRIQHFA